MSAFRRHSYSRGLRPMLALHVPASFITSTTTPPSSSQNIEPLNRPQDFDQLIDLREKIDYLELSSQQGNDTTASRLQHSQLRWDDQGLPSGLHTPIQSQHEENVARLDPNLLSAGSGTMDSTFGPSRDLQDLSSLGSGPAAEKAAPLSGTSHKAPAMSSNQSSGTFSGLMPLPDIENLMDFDDDLEHLMSIEMSAPFKPSNPTRSMDSGYASLARNDEVLDYGSPAGGDGLISAKKKGPSGGTGDQGMDSLLDPEAYERLVKEHGNDVIFCDWDLALGLGAFQDVDETNVDHYQIPPLAQVPWNPLFASRHHQTAGTTSSYQVDLSSMHVTAAGQTNFIPADSACYSQFQAFGGTAHSSAHSSRSGRHRHDGAINHKSVMTLDSATDKLASGTVDSEDDTLKTSHSDGELSFMGATSPGHIREEELRTKISPDILHKIVSAVVDEYIQKRSNVSDRIRTCPSGEPASQAWLARGLTSSPKGGSQDTSSNKRKRGDEDDKDRNEGERDNKKPKWKPHPPRTHERLRPLACPYAKYDHARYSEENTLICEKEYRHCSSVYASDIPRVKQHLYRVHLRPEFYCDVCFQDFEYDHDKAAHIRARACVERLCPFEEKMDADRQKKVKETIKGESAEDSWYRIYRVLFEGADPDSPFSDGPWRPVVEGLVHSFTERGPEIYQSIISPFLNEALPELQLDQRNTVLFIEEMAIRELLERLSSGTYPAAASSTQGQLSVETVSSDARMLRDPQLMLFQSAGTAPDVVGWTIHHPNSTEEARTIAHQNGVRSSDVEEARNHSIIDTDLLTSATTLTDQTSSPESSTLQGSSESWNPHVMSNMEPVPDGAGYDWPEEWLDFCNHDKRMLQDATEVLVSDNRTGMERDR